MLWWLIEKKLLKADHKVCDTVDMIGWDLVSATNEHWWRDGEVVEATLGRKNPNTNWKYFNNTSALADLSETNETVKEQRERGNWSPRHCFTKAPPYR